MRTNTSLSSQFRLYATLALVVASMIGGARQAEAQYDPTADFSASSNPNGVWTYGYESEPLGSTFHLLPNSVPVPAKPGPTIDSWQTAIGELAVLHNGTNTAEMVNTALDSALYGRGMLAMHPGTNDEFAIVQFTAPTQGLYSIQGTFLGIDTSWTTSDVYLLYNNVPLIVGTVTGYGTTFEVPLSIPPLLLKAGDTLSYAVGGDGFHDTTALINAQVTAASVPEPSAFVLLGIACAAVGAWAWRRRGAGAHAASSGS